VQGQVLDASLQDILFETLDYSSVHVVLPEDEVSIRGYGSYKVELL
jgi:hypothetical protein